LASAASAAVTVNPYQEFGSTECTVAGDCAIVFPKVVEETLVLRVLCAFALANTASISFASLGTQNANTRNALQVFARGTLESTTNYTINVETYLFVSKGDQPRIDVFALNASVTGLIRTVSGNRN
jgi:hypothetical protein